MDMNMSDRIVISTDSLYVLNPEMSPTLKYDEGKCYILYKGTYIAAGFSGADVYVYVLCIPKEEYLLYLLQLLLAYHQILALNHMF